MWTGIFGVEEGWDCSSMRVMVQNQGGMSVSTLDQRLSHLLVAALGG